MSDSQKIIVMNPDALIKINTMSDTPLTDIANKEYQDMCNENAVCPEFARYLERGRAAAIGQLEQLRELLLHADQILDDIDTCSDAHKPMYSSYFKNVSELCIKGRAARRAALKVASTYALTQEANL